MDCVNASSNIIYRWKSKVGSDVYGLTQWKHPQHNIFCLLAGSDLADSRR